MTDADLEGSTNRVRPGPRRPDGAPAGPDEVRRAVLDVAADLFARHGVSEVSLRGVAAAANVQLSLIARYIGNRDELIAAVFDDLTEELARDVVERPLEQISFERDSVMGRWTIMLTHYAVTGVSPGSSAFNPMLALAQVIERSYGVDERAARLRGAQIVASALGWRIFETYLIEAGGLDQDREALRDELTAMHRRLGATPWPSPPDPPTVASG
jgi:AcrR family transcriptional regulator